MELHFDAPESSLAREISIAEVQLRLLSRPLSATLVEGFSGISTGETTAPTSVFGLAEPDLAIVILAATGVLSAPLLGDQGVAVAQDAQRSAEGGGDRPLPARGKR